MAYTPKFCGVCPNCKNGSGFEQVKPKVFRCSNCGFKMEISEDWTEIIVTLEGKNWLYPRNGYFKSYR